MKKGDRFILARTLDLRSTGGPLLPKDTPGTVEKVRRTGELWVNLDTHGHRHLNPGDVATLPLGCQRCGCPVGDGLCTDCTCPFSDHEQSCPVGWTGHPDHDEAHRECSCKKVAAFLAMRASRHGWTPDDVAGLVGMEYDRRHGNSLEVLIAQAIEEGDSPSWLREQFSQNCGTPPSPAP